MKTSAIIGLIALALAPLALSKVSMTPQALGQVESTLNFCGGINPKDEALYKEWAKRLVAEATKEELTNLRNSSEYKDAYESTTKELSKVSKEKGLKACQALVGQK